MISVPRSKSRQTIGLRPTRSISRRIGRSYIRQLSQTTTSALQVADELGAESLALPAFGTGVGGFPLDECARLMVDAVRAHEPRTLRRVVFAVYGEEARRAFEGAIAKA